MNKTYPKISIVTPSYNQGRFIESAIQSVLSQNYPNFEHIILDNCSTDETVEILQKYPHLVWKSKPDKGQSDALNQGFRLATGDIIGWLNADDLYLPKCFEQTVKSFANSAESSIAYGDYRWVNEQGQVIQFRKELDFDWFILKYLHVLYIPSTSTFFKRKIFEEENFLDTSLKYSMDYEFFLRLARQKYHFVHINSYLADFRWHQENKSTIAYLEQKEEKTRALLRHDSFLQKIPPHIQSLIRNLLEILARGKRYFLKGFKGYYFKQWQTKSS
ncbi:glycosyltransferase [Pleurocapsa sp. CCALA 161]|uniref:glycosyltransferase family 2 protein n=1 Tax=Pleurocapsa sp. CCALA 161 TaxID=2107688 RepID=UPI000D074B2B|nr:glycosyltransferase family 2 protein [Pleurocapsa sp. CCALA 161]PSB08080.1 glycosyltransferase [Pleurocapsa sp. CCALA 161]